MKWSKQKEFSEFLIDNGVIEFKKTKLSSGKNTPFYFNLRKLSQDVETLDKTIYCINLFLDEKKIDNDFFIGVPEGATKLGLFLTYNRSKYHDKNSNLVMGRGKEKEHGRKKDRCYIGDLEESVVVIEDVLTTGGSMIKEINRLKSLNIKIDYALGLVDRLELSDGLSVSEKMSKLNVDYYSLTDVKTLLPLACEKLKPSKGIIKKINRYYKKYGCDEIKINI